LATEAVEGGKANVNGASVKPAKDIKIGDRLQIRAGDLDWEILVKGVNEQRRPAAEAQLLYEETSDSQHQRAKVAELRKLAPMPVQQQKGRPTKRDRRQLGRFREN